MRTFRQFINEQEDDIGETFHGVHYSTVPNLHALSGSKSGTGIKGAEQERVKQSSDERLRKRVYFYPKPANGLPQPEAGLGRHVYEAKIPKMLNADADTEENKKVSATAHKFRQEGEESSNAFERAVLHHGYHGYHTPQMGVVLGRHVDVDYKGMHDNKNFVPLKANTAVKQQSVFDALPNKEGEHTSSLLSNPQTTFFLKNRAALTTAAPSLKMQYGRLVVNKEHLGNLKDELSKHDSHPF